MQDLVICWIFVEDWEYSRKFLQYKNICLYMKFWVMSIHIKLSEWEVENKYICVHVYCHDIFGYENEPPIKYSFNVETV